MNILQDGINFTANMTRGSGFIRSNLSSRGSLQDLLDYFAPWLGEYFATWLKLDINTVAAAVTIFGMLSAAMGRLQRVGARTYWWITKFFTASVSISGNDRLNKEVLNWLGVHVLPRQGTRILTARTESIDADDFRFFRGVGPARRNDRTLEKRVPVTYLPTFGSTWFVHDLNVFIVGRMATRSRYSRESGVPDEYASAPDGREPIVIQCLGRSVGPIKRFLDTCRDFAEKQRNSYVAVRSVESRHNGHELSWKTTLRPLRSLDTVHFNEKTKEDLVADIRKYLDPATQRFYNNRGIPYRRGYLLHGPAGTGKTSLSLALAGMFGLELYLVHIPAITSDGNLEYLFANLPPRCFVLLEDIDAVGIRRELENDDVDDSSPKHRIHSQSITLSGLLNVLDGVASQEGRIVLMTSNFAEKLDLALVRPGRIDRMIFLGNISQRSAEMMFLRMYQPDSERDPPCINPDPADGEKTGKHKRELDVLALAFSRQIPDSTFTPAQLQGYLLRHSNEPTTAVAETAAWIAEETAAMDEAKRLEMAAAEARERKKNEKKKNVNMIFTSEDALGYPTHRKAIKVL